MTASFRLRDVPRAGRRAVVDVVLGVSAFAFVGLWLAYMAPTTVLAAVLNAVGLLIFIGIGLLKLKDAQDRVEALDDAEDVDDRPQEVSM